MPENAMKPLPDPHIVTTQEPNIGALLDYGLAQMPRQNHTSHDDDHHAVSPVSELIKIAAGIPATDLYQKAYDRWLRQIKQNQAQIACWTAELDSRMFLARGETSILETSVRLHQTYGVPYIAGSMLKGLARAYALGELDRIIGLSERFAYLFGREPNDNEQDKGDAGFVIFHDAWWVPKSAPMPLLQEVITPHHGDYYQGHQPQPRDTDSPTITPQIAVRGAFMFAVEGEGKLIEMAQSLLQSALQKEGLGNRRHLGYGLFDGFSQSFN
jgi:CRISPR-associated protein Cmr6